MSVEVYKYDNLIAGEAADLITDTIIVASGQTLPRGALLGRILRALGAPVAGANTGNGTLTAVAMGTKTRIGNYTLVCSTAAANGGTFKVLDPDGVRLDDAKVGVAYSNAHLAFTLNDGAADFVVGDSFTIPVTAGTKKGVLVDSSKADGSNIGHSVLAQAIDSTAGDVVAPAYIGGEFNSAAMTFGGTDTADTHKDPLRDLGIFLKSTVAS
jgi:hypothetical protein